MILRLNLYFCHISFPSYFFYPHQKFSIDSVNLLLYPMNSNVDILLVLYLKISFKVCIYYPMQNNDNLIIWNSESNIKNKVVEYK